MALQHKRDGLTEHRFSLSEATNATRTHYPLMESCGYPDWYIEHMEWWDGFYW